MFVVIMMAPVAATCGGGECGDGVSDYGSEGYGSDPGGLTLMVVAVTAVGGHRRWQ